MIRAGVGVSYGGDPHAVGADACQEAKNRLGGREANAAIVFSSVQYDQQQVLYGVRSVLRDDVTLVGSSTAGEITNQGPAQNSSVAVMLLFSDTVRFYGGIGEGISTSPADAGRSLARRVQGQASDDEVRAFIMMPDVLSGNGAETVRGVLEVLGPHFPVVGGASGDDFRFQRTYQYFGDTAYTNAVAGLGLAGDFRFGVGVRHGWIPVGIPRQVTKAEGSVLHELDGKPAISVYEDYFGEEKAKELRGTTLAQLAVTYPLGMKVEGSDEMLIRDPLSVDEHGSITCAAEIPKGSEIRLMIGSREEAVKVAKEAATNAVSMLDGATPRAVLLFNCIARKKLFGEFARDEIEAIQEAVGKETPLIGFYTYGEQAPLGGEVRNIEKCNPTFHNETAVIFVLGD